MGRLFGTDGIRDRVGQGVLAPAQTLRFARAVGYLIKKSPEKFHTLPPAAFPGPREAAGEKLAKGRILIGRDSRGSGSEIEWKLLEGFLSMGVPTATVGVLPTPGIVHMVRAMGAQIGIVISASHNPAEDNGLKLISPQGFKIPDAAEMAIEDLYFDEVLGTKLQKSDTLKISPPKDLESKTSIYLDLLAAGNPSLSCLKIVVDAAEGATSAFAGPLFGRLGAKVTVIHAKPDGKNINAGCGALHPQDLARAVVREKAHAGVAFDGDGDRAIFADETGAIRDGDHVLALCAEDLKTRGKLPGNVVVSTVMANFGLERFLKDRGVELVRTRVGDRYVADEMMKRGAVLGGEQSGHVIFFDQATAGDGLLTAVRLFSMLKGRAFSGLCQGLKKCPQTLVNIKVKSKPPMDQVAPEAIRQAEKELAGRGRVLVRYSGTEDLCRVMVEAEDSALVDRLAQSVSEAVRKQLS